LLSCAIRAIRRPAGAGAWSGMDILSDDGAGLGARLAPDSA